MNEVKGVALSQEELLVALLSGGLPALAGHDDLEGRVFGELPAQHRPVLLAAGERALAARGFLMPGAAELALDPILFELLASCARPSRTWLIMYQQRGEADQTTYVHEAATLVAHTERLGLHQFVELGGRSDLRTLLAGLIEVEQISGGMGLRGELTEETFAQAAASQEPAASLRAKLEAGGLDGPVATALAAAMIGRTAITVCALFKHERQPALREIFTLISASPEAWAVWPADQGLLRAQQVDQAAIAELLDRLEATADSSQHKG